MHLQGHPTTNPEELVEAALSAFERGWIPVPIATGQKRPSLPQWNHLTYAGPDQIRSTFIDPKVGGIGLILGDASRGLVDVDLDHPKARRIAAMFLPPTSMMTGRATTRHSHYWYQITDEHVPEGTRRYKMPDGSTCVELRSTGGQTVIPPTIHPSGELLLWEKDPWGGEEGPSSQQGRVLSARVTTLALASVLVDGWPTRGGRHDSYLALAGGLLRIGTSEQTGIHPLWAEALPNLIRAIAEATNDEDGPDTRVHETMESTLDRLRTGRRVQGFPTLAKIIGDDHVELVRRYSREIENTLGHQSRAASVQMITDITESEEVGGERVHTSTLPAEDRNPLDERVSTWDKVDIEPYLMGEIKPAMPTLLSRSDGKPLFYPGRVNCLYGASESGKTWIALYAIIEEISRGNRCIFVDCEDDPESTLSRMMMMGVGPDDLISSLTYVRPEEALARLMFNRWGNPIEGEAASRLRDNDRALEALLGLVDPKLIVLDGLTVLYGLHGMDTNDATHTDRISGWMKQLTHNGRTTVVVIDHTPKSAGRGSLPLGSQHKTAMIQGAALQVWPLDKPRPGVLAKSELVIGKDRPGQVRAVGNDGDPQVAAEIEIDSRTPGQVQVRILPPMEAKKSIVVGHDDKTTKALNRIAEQRTRLLRALREDLSNEASPGLSKRELLLAAGGNKANAEALIRELIDQGAVDIAPGPRQRVFHRLAERSSD